MVQSTDLTNWAERAAPEPRIFEGQWCRLEPLNFDHADGLYDVATAPDADARFRWLFESRPQDRVSFDQWFEGAVSSEDPLFFAVIDKRSNTVEGRQTLMRINPAHGVIEIGNIHWGGKIARTPATTEAFFCLQTMFLRRWVTEGLSGSATMPTARRNGRRSAMG